MDSFSSESIQLWATINPFAFHLTALPSILRTMLHCGYSSILDWLGTHKPEQFIQFVCKTIVDYLDDQGNGYNTQLVTYNRDCRWGENLVYRNHGYIGHISQRVHRGHSETGKDDGNWQMFSRIRHFFDHTVQVIPAGVSKQTGVECICYRTGAPVWTLERILKSFGVTWYPPWWRCKGNTIYEQN